MEIVLAYKRDHIIQQTGWWCGPASTQTVIYARGKLIDERELMLELEALEGNRGWDDQDGTDSIVQVTTVLNRHTGGRYATVQMPTDPPTRPQREALWRHLVESVGAGFGAVANIVAPPGRGPRAVSPSTVSPDYGGGWIYHYFCVMGVSDEGGRRRVWVADSGFRPYGYWMDFDQLAVLIAGKGYSYATVGAEIPADPPPPSGLTPATLADAMGRRDTVDYNAFYVPFCEAMRIADITTVPRARMWFAQLGHESGGLYYTEEIADGSAYEGRRDLGNVQPGDGRRFKGRGSIQITGRTNYSEYSKWAFNRRLVPSPSYFVDNPRVIADVPRWSLMAAAWYWSSARPQLNALSDAGDVRGATIAINGGTTHLDDRQRRYDLVARYGERLLPPTTGDASMAGEHADAELRKRYPSRSRYRAGDGPVDTAVGMILNSDARQHEEFVRHYAYLGAPECVAILERAAAAGDPLAKLDLDEARRRAAARAREDADR